MINFAVLKILTSTIEVSHRWNLESCLAVTTNGAFAGQTKHLTIGSESTSFASMAFAISHGPHHGEIRHAAPICSNWIAMVWQNCYIAGIVTDVQAKRMD